MAAHAYLDYLPKNNVDYRAQINSGIHLIAEAYDKKTVALQSETIAAIKKWEEAKNQLSEEQRKERKLQNEMSDVTQRTNVVTQETVALKEKLQKSRCQLLQLDAIQDAVRQCFSDEPTEMSKLSNISTSAESDVVLSSSKIDTKAFFRNARKKLPPERFSMLTTEIDQCNRGIISFTTLMINGQALLSSVDPQLGDEFARLVKRCMESQTTGTIFN